MLLATTLATTLAGLSHASIASAPNATSRVQDRRAEVAAQYQTLFEKLDDVAMQAVWNDNRDLMLTTFDADLEASLRIWEEAPDGSRRVESDKLRNRALWGATLATQVTQNPIFADYAVSFAGWGAEERKTFRSGQAAYKSGMLAFRKTEFAEALAAGAACREAAEPLGDWWGTAMGLTLEGMAHEARGETLSALRKTSRARLLNHQLGLRGSEYQNLRGMISQLTTLERWERAHLTADAAIGIARAMKDTGGVIENLRHRARIEKALGFDQAAQATEAEAAKLED